MKAPFTGRREDERLVTGAGAYTDDHRFARECHAAFLRSELAHARFALDKAAAAAAPGVLAVLDAADMAASGYRRFVPHLPFQGRDGPLRTREMPVFADGRARYVGEPLAVVIAQTRPAALDAVERIAVDYDPLPPVAALDGDPPAILYDEVPGNVCMEYDFGDAAATDAAFARATHVARLTLASARVVANPMEPKAAIALWEGETLHLWSPSQGMTSMRDELASATGLPPERVRVHAGDIGGAFGVRGNIYPEYVAIALASRRLDRPVRWLADRSETFLSDFQGRAVTMTGELALDADGNFLGIRHRWLCDMGGWPSSSGPVTVILNASQMAFGAYRIPAVSGHNRLVLTSKVPTCAYRGAGRPEMAYMVERLVDEAARVSGIDRVELRRRNRIPREAFPYPVPSAPFPTAYDIADFDVLLDRALARADWQGFAQRREAAARAGKLRGIGCALFIEPAGGVAPSDEAAVTFDPDGGIVVHMVALASGQGHETVLPEIVAGALDIAPDRVTLRAGRQDGPALKGAPAFGSRTLMSQGSAAVEAAGRMLATARRLAAGELDAKPEDLDYAGGVFRLAGSNRSLELAELARRRPGELDTVAELPAPRNFPSGAHVAEVEIDPATGVTNLVRYISVDDCGTVLNPVLVEGQIWGGLVQGLGQVFGEACIYDDDCQVLSGSFMDYPMPRADIAPHVSIENVEIASPTNRLGAKGVGEAGTVGALPAAMNAILDALGQADIAHFDMPATPNRVWEVLSAARRRRGARTGGTD